MTKRYTWLAIILTTLGPTVAAAFYVHGTQDAAVTQTIYAASKVLLNLFPLAWWLLYEKAGGTAGSRLPGKPMVPERKDVLRGALSGLLMAAGIGAVYAIFLRSAIDPDVLREQVRAFGAYDHFILFALFLAILNSGLEEYYWRWFVYGRMREKLGVALSVLLSACAFAAHHFVVLQQFLQNAGLAALLSGGIALGGVIWAWHYQRCGRLWGIWLSHFLVDVAIMLIAYRLLF